MGGWGKCEPYTRAEAISCSSHLILQLENDNESAPSQDDKKQTNKSKTLSQGMEMMKKASSDDEATFSTESPFSFSDFPKPFE